MIFMSIIYLNGQYLPLEQASISPLDRGFTFGDGVYEVIPAYNRHIFRADEHLRRLDNSLRLIYMSNPLSYADWQTVLNNIVARNEGVDQSIYLQVTRGLSPRDHAFDSDIKATVFVMSSPLLQPDNRQGVSAILRDDIRWQWCHIKAITLLPGVLLRYEARLHGAKEAILIRQGQLTEGAASNVFVCRNDIVLTPPKSKDLLPGITRDLVIELLQKAGQPCKETNVSEQELRHADEIWLTSSTQEIVPVTRLDGKPVGRGGPPGPLWQKAAQLYQQFKREFYAGADSGSGK